MRHKSILFLLVFIPINVFALQNIEIPEKVNSKKAIEYYNYSYRLFNYIQAKGKFKDFEELLRITKKGISYAKPTDFRELSGLQYLTGLTYKIALNSDSALYYLQNSIKNAQRGNILDTEISAIQQINYLYRFLGQVEETDRYIKRLNILKTELKDIYLKDRVISALSDDFLHRGSYTQAVDLLLGSLNTKEYIYKKKKDYLSRINLGLAFSELGSLYLQLNQNQNALNFLKKGEPYFSDYTGGRVRLFRKMEQAYLNLSKVDSATIYYKKIYAEMKVDVYESADDISNANRVFAEYYLSKNNINKAIKYAEVAYQKAVISESREALLMATNMMGNLRFQQKKYHNAIQFFEKALPNSNNFSKDIFASINLHLAQSYEYVGDYKKANLFYNKYNILRENIYLEKTKEDLNIIEFKYKNAQKEQRIDFLNVQSKNQEKEITRQKQYKTILSISVMLVLIIAGLIFYNYKNKQSVNLLLDKKNQELDALNSQLVNANQTKTKLFSIISHDLRSPVSQLFTYLKIQLSPNQIPEEEKLNHQKKLLLAASNVLITMEDLLLWSKSQMENFELDVEEIEIELLFNQVVALLQNQAEAKNLKINIGELALNTIQSDQNLLMIVLRNLLQNAINHSFINTSILLNANVDENNKAFFTIENIGNAISEEKIKEILNSKSVKSKSFGYGLVIVKELLQKLNGNLEIESANDFTKIKVSFF